MVVGGVTIGEGSVVAAGSTVTKDIPPYTLAAGVPARVLRQITDEDLEREEAEEAAYRKDRGLN